MIVRRILMAAAMTAAVAFTITSAAARADECDDIMDALKKLNERVMNAKDDVKTVPAVCAAIGQVMGILKASRETAAECYDDGNKRSNILRTFDRATKDMEAQLDSTCK